MDGSERDRSAQRLNMAGSRRRFVARLAALPLSAEMAGITQWPVTQAEAQGTPAASPVTPEEDARFMRLALDEARRGVAQGNAPFGAVIVRGGEVLASAHNTGSQDGDPTAHGEMNAIRVFLANYDATEFQGTTLYTTGEPCVMCTGAIIWCGISRMVFAASVEQLATKIGQIMISSQEIVDRETFAPVEITGGVLAGEAVALFDLMPASD